MAALVRTLLARLFQAIGVVWLVGTLCFALTSFLPGDLALELSLARYGELGNQELTDKIRSDFKLQDATLVRYGSWLLDLSRLDLGRSMVSGEPVLDLLMRRWIRTLELAIPAFILSLLIAFPLGTAAGTGRLVGLANAFSASMAAIPSFLLGIILIGIFALHWRLLPPAGSESPVHSILPILTLALGLAGVSCRIVRDSVAQHWNCPALQFARLKGLPERQVFLRHLLPLALPAIFSFSSLQFVYLLDGFVVLESLFAYPGLGDLLAQSVLQRDIPVIQGIALSVAWVFVMANACSDLVLARLDPRLSHPTEASQ